MGITAKRRTAQVGAGWTRGRSRAEMRSPAAVQSEGGATRRLGIGGIAAGRLGDFGGWSRKQQPDFEASKGVDNGDLSRRLGCKGDGDRSSGSGAFNCSGEMAAAA